MKLAAGWTLEITDRFFRFFLSSLLGGSYEIDFTNRPADGPLGERAVQDMTSLNNADLFDVPLESSVALKVMDYVHPSEVLQDDRLGPTDKRAILCAWASDACAVESRPGFRWLKGTPGPILVDHVLAALNALDAMTGLQVPRHDASMLRQGHLRAGKSTDPRVSR